MRKSAQTIPNQKLRDERELRGWSQKYVADQIGADHYYLSRWERGTASPSPYYRRKLCAIFGKNARELGLLAEEHDESADSRADDSSSGSELLSVSPAFPDVIHDSAIPLPPAGTAGLVGRHDMLRQLKQRLCNNNNLVLTALNGIGNFWLAHDNSARTASSAA